MTINWKHIAHDVVVFGGIAESVLSIAGVIGPRLPAGDVAVISAVSGGVGFVVAFAEDVAAGKDPTSSLGRFVSFVIGFFAHSTPQPAATNPANKRPAKTRRSKNPIVG